MRDTETYSGVPGPARSPADPRAASLIWPALLALLAWSAFAVFMFALPQLQGGAPTQWDAVLPRVGKLALYSKEFFLGPLALLFLMGLLGRLVQRGRPLGHALTDGLRFGFYAFGASALLWAAIAGWAALEGEEPWERLPGMTPPYLEDFLARHPGMETETYGGTRELRLYDGRGHSLFVNGDDLTGTAVKFEPCAPGDSDPAALGGIPPYPGSRCDTLVRMRRGGVERVIHAFAAPRDDSHEQIRLHFERWAKSLGAEPGYMGGPYHFYFTAGKEGRQWDVRLFVSRTRATEIYIPRGGRTPAWPAGQ